MSDLYDQEKTESPTQKRLEDARKRGQVPRSRDLSAAAVTLAGGLGLYGVGQLLGGRMLSLMRQSMSFTRDELLQPERMLDNLGDAALQAALGAAPLLGLLLAAALLAPLLIGGWTFSSTALAPDWQRLDPVAGMGRVFSARGLLEVLKSLARFAVVALVAVLVLRHDFSAYTALGSQSVRTGIAQALSLCGEAFILFGGGLALIALVDVPLSLWQHNRSLRMSREEIRQEAKETDGNPEVRGRIRRTQQEMSRRRMMEEVPRADVIVTNPTHYAVALRYDEQRMRAPIVVAKGADLVALQIRRIAGLHSVPIVEAPPLARALHAGCTLGDEVPARLYAAVAQLLTYVYQLRTARRRGGALPELPHIETPADL